VPEPWSGHRAPSDEVGRGTEVGDGTSGGDRGAKVGHGDEVGDGMPGTMARQLGIGGWGAALSNGGCGPCARPLGRRVPCSICGSLLQGILK
jgi:hypothetical protein